MAPSDIEQKMADKENEYRLQTCRLFRQMVNQYVNNRLPDMSFDVFEKHCLECDECCKAVLERAERLANKC